MTREGIRYFALAVVGVVLAVALVGLLILSAAPETHSQGQDGTKPTTPTRDRPPAGPTPTPVPDETRSQ